MQKIRRPKTLKAQAYEFILEAILNHTMETETIYSEQWIADKFQISRTPVREALLQLREENLIEVLPNRGVIIKPLTMESAKNVFQTRIAIEGYCAAYMAMHAQEENVQNLIKKMYVDLEHWIKDYDRNAEMQMHIDIIEYCGNPEFIAQFNRLRTKIDIFWDSLFDVEGRKEETYGEHKKIIDAIRSGDDVAAYRAIAEHMHFTQKVLERSPLFSGKSEKQD